MTEQEGIKKEDEEFTPTNLSKREVAYRTLIYGLAQFKADHYTIVLDEGADQNFSVNKTEQGREIIDEDGEVLEVWDKHAKVFDDPAEAVIYGEENVELYPEHMKVEKMYVLPEKWTSEMALTEEGAEMFDFKGTILSSENDDE